MALVENPLRKTHQEILREKVSSGEKLLMGKVEMHLDPGDIDDWFRERARIELRENPELTQEGLETLRELLKGEPDLNVPTDDDFLKRFLRPCKWYPKSSFELMKRFYKFRLTHPRYFENLTPSHEKVVLCAGTMRPLPVRTFEGSRVVLIEGGKKWKPKEVPLDSMFRGIILFLEAVITEPRSQVAGARVMIDMDGLSLSHVTYFTPSFASAVVEFVQKCLPCRLKGIHIVNQPFIFNMVFAIFKPFLHEKLRKRIIFHGSDRASLMKYIDAKALPTKYGGDLDIPIDEPIGDTVYKYFYQFEDAYIENNKLGYPKKASK